MGFWDCQCEFLDLYEQEAITLEIWLAYQRVSCTNEAPWARRVE